MGTRTARCDEHQRQPRAQSLMNLDGSRSSWVAVKKKTICDACRQRRVCCNWRAHAQATSERVQSRSGTVPYQQRPQRISPQLSILFRHHRARSTANSAASLHSRHASLQELRSLGALRRRRCVSKAAISCTKLAPPQGTALGIVHQSDYYSVPRRCDRASRAYGSRSTNCPVGRGLVQWQGSLEQ